MKRQSLLFPTLFLISIIIHSCNSLPDFLVDALSGASKAISQDGNSLYHQTDEISLIQGELSIQGEVKNPGEVDFDNYYKREVVTKESLYKTESGTNFIGAYRYRGYSLFDILHSFNLDKKNAEIFRPAIDLYIIIENEKGESVVFSWSEIFHINNPHQVIIATEAAPIVPYKKEVDYEISKNWKIIAANDLFSYRNLDNPTKITVRSFDEKEYIINRDLDTVYSSGVKVFLESGKELYISQTNNKNIFRRYYSSFYGMGMGYHESSYFEGPVLQKLLNDSINIFNPQMISNGLVCFAGIDGYRAIYSYSEIFNRTDQISHILAITPNPKNGGYYRIFHPAEFYADRSVKALAEIYFFEKN